MGPQPQDDAAFAPRKMLQEDLDWAAAVWHQGWHDGHAGIVPQALTALRGLEQFRDRLIGYGDGVRVIGPQGQPYGLCVTRDDHLDQLFVARHMRGGGIARILMRDGEARLRAAGVRRAYLDCAPGNHRAVAFYLREGWREGGLVPILVETVKGPFELTCKQFQKRL